MLVGGSALAAFALAAMAIARREQADSVVHAPPPRDAIAASLLVQILMAGGMRDDEAMRRVRREGGLAAPVTRGIDVANWGEAYARVSDQRQRESLLELAVRLLAESAEPVPIRQYAALLDLSFSLGFQTDALARLRELYGFTYVDHAKDGRPRDADRSGGAAPLFARDTRDQAELLRVLELDGSPSRQTIMSAYRKLAARHHPDRFFGQPEAVQTAAANRFIEVTQAYESLLAIYRD